MNPDVVVDIGNSRIKWGRCINDCDEVESASLPGDARAAWDSQLQAWDLRGPLTWAVASVQPRWQENFVRWAESRGDNVHIITYKQIPFPIEVDEPESVGIDRLLNAVAAHWLKPARMQAIVVSAGTAVTVDLVRELGSFAGGAIFPGPRLMTEALHQFTAKLPLVPMERIEDAEPPGKNTRAAIQTGVASAIKGGVSLLVERMALDRKQHTWVILTGGALGDLADFSPANFARVMVCPSLTLVGLRLTAESLP